MSDNGRKRGEERRAEQRRAEQERRGEEVEEVEVKEVSAVLVLPLACADEAKGPHKIPF
jgi:hypothetical protein